MFSTIYVILLYNEYLFSALILFCSSVQRLYNVVQLVCEIDDLQLNEFVAANELLGNAFK